MKNRTSRVSTARLAALASLALLPAFGSTLARAADSAEFSPGININDFANMSVEDLFNVKVTTVSRRLESLDLAPNTIYAFTHDQIRNRGYHHLRELLETVPGFGIAPTTLRNNGRIRGIAANDNEKFSILVDGHVLNGLAEPTYFDGAYTLDNVERVEVIVGPGSVLYGAETLAATINLITRDTDGVEAIFNTGTPNLYSGTLNYGHKWSSERSFRASLTALQRGGYDYHARPQIGPGGLNNKELINKVNISTNVTANLLWDGWQVDFSMFKLTRPETLQESNNASVFKGVYNGEYAYQETTAGLFVRRNFTFGDEWTAFAQVSATYKEYQREGDWNVRQLGYGAELGVQWQHQDTTFQAGLQLAYKDNYDGELGVPISGSPVFNQTTRRQIGTIYGGTGGVRGEVFGNGHTSDSVGAYASIDHRFTPWLKAVGAIRADRDTVLVRDLKWNIGGRLALVASPTKNWTSKLMFNRSVRVPSSIMSPLDTAFGSGVPVADRNPLIAPARYGNPIASRPEILTTFEWQNIVYIGPVRASATVFHQELKDFISWNRPFTNVGDFEGNGFEMDIKADVTRNFSVWGNVAYVKNKFTITGSLTGPILPTLLQSPTTPSGAPELQINGGFEWNLTPNLVLTGQGRYFTREHYLDTTVNPRLDSRLDDRLQVDAALTWRDAFHVKGLEVQLSGRNLLNNRDPVVLQWSSNLVEPEGATGMLTVGYKF